jgi:hypothetical protein
MVHFQGSILECLHHHTLSSMFFNGIFEAHCTLFYHVSALGMLLAYSSTNLPNLSIIFPNFLHNTSWLGLPHPSIVGFP